MREEIIIAILLHSAGLFHNILTVLIIIEHWSAEYIEFKYSTQRHNLSCSKVCKRTDKVITSTVNV